MYCLEKLHMGSWTIVGQYRTRDEADRIAADYRSRGEQVRITTDE